MTNPVPATLAQLVARFGFRFSNLDARRAGVSEHVLFDACVLGLAKMESSVVSFRAGASVTTYTVFA